ncbi:MAG: DUF5312 domain-containing protein [Treponema sp.]|jgi:hypothetical protein|nr:DUF5312 domain-containing protein [Treponema sp.]
MSYEDTTDTFDRLVLGISDDERKQLLDRVKSDGTESGRAEDRVSVNDIDDTTDLIVRLRSESIFYRIYLWLKALFTNASVEVLYSEDLINAVGRHIDHNFPGLIDRKHGYLLTIFYHKFEELRNVAGFFRPYIDKVEQDPGAFYVYLGSVGMSESHKAIDEAANPYSLPLTKEATSEARLSMLRHMDQLMKDLPSNDRAVMYPAVRAVEWLRHFVNLPFKHFLALFTNIVADSYSCTFSDADNMFADFANCICNVQTIPEILLKTLYIYSGSGKIPDDFNDIPEAVEDEEFLQKASAQISMIHMFSNTVPMKDISCVLYQNIRWQPLPFGGHEDWFVKYKAQWKKIFDQRWKSWLTDCKKQRMLDQLKLDFKLESFPELPYRPWSALWGGMKFNHELTAGFLYWFFNAKFPESFRLLRTLLVEGVFLNKDNRQEFSNGLDEYSKMSLEFESFIERLSPRGSAGIVFEKLASRKMQTIQGQNKVDSVMLGMESEISSLELDFCAVCRKIELILNGILSLKKDTRYDTLQNISTIQGSENKKFIAAIAALQHSLHSAAAFLNDLEPLENSF